MSAPGPDRIPDLPDRHELRETPAWVFAPDRRDALKLLGGGLVVVLLLDGPAAAQEAPPRRGGRRGGGDPPREVGAWLAIGEDGAVTVLTGKVEVGQDIRTSLAQAVADELGVATGSVRLVMGDTALVPFDQGTFGSRTTPSMASWLRQVAAAAREALLDLAAAEWNADRATIVVEAGQVREPASGRIAGFGAIVRGRRLTKAVDAGTAVRPAAAWTAAGFPAPRVTGQDLVTGAHRFPSDIVQPGLLHGRVLRPPAAGATLAAADTARAEAMDGVTVVRDGSFVGVAARTAHAAAQALAAIGATWKDPPPGPSHREVHEHLRKSAEAGRTAHAAGSIEEGLAGSGVRLDATYTTAYIAHAPLEPRAATAAWEGDRVTVWTGTQRPFGVRGEVAQAFDIPEDRVRVIVPDTGAGFGGKHTGEAAVEAARLARAAGKPVKVCWTREEEFAAAYFRPAATIDVKAGATEDGALSAWEFRVYNAGAAGIRTPYEVQHQLVVSHGSDSPLRQGSYRALAATACHFARESHMDDLARAAGQDPLAFRLRNLKDGRLRAVLEAAAKRFGWKGRPGRPSGSGLACGFEKGGYVATCAEVRVVERRLAVIRLVTAFECGAVVNPTNLRSQVEGAVIMGLGGALFEEVPFAGGKVLGARFSEYRVPRFADLPALETVILDRKDLPSAGAGETPIVAVAPAIANAILDAAGVRLRALPLAPDGSVG